MDAAEVAGAMPLVQTVGAVLWPSFFAACVATMVFFGFVDPTELGTITFPQVQVSREWGYTLGFFMFWACTFSSSLFTWILLRPRAEIDRPQRR
ncbi:MAG: hypothetical protein DYH17_04170 [Xanthomonadales bacterium PRO6]|nr:hypothetical protein [Xanthomonadales bacterium PRO6]